MAFTSDTYRSGRKADGTTLIELSVAAPLVAMAAMLALALVLGTYKSARKISNIVDSNSAVAVALERLGKDIRQGRWVGDIYGAAGNTNAAYFPSSQDPVYGNGQLPPGGWPTWPTDAAPAPGKYALSQSCLIVQVPIFDSNGFPTEIVHGQGTPAVQASAVENVETHIYRVVPDPNNAGQFELQMARIPGFPVTGYVPANNAYVQTLVSNIVGPLDASGNPIIFQYVDRTDATGTPAVTPNQAVLPNYTSCIVNLEVFKNQNDAAQPSTVGFKTEHFLRNSLFTSGGGP